MISLDDSNAEVNLKTIPFPCETAKNEKQSSFLCGLLLKPRFLIAGKLGQIIWLNKNWSKTFGIGFGIWMTNWTILDVFNSTNNRNHFQTWFYPKKGSILNQIILCGVVFTLCSRPSVSSNVVLVLFLIENIFAPQFLYQKRHQAQ